MTLDTSALFALFSADDRDHARVRAALLADRGPYLVPAATLGELGYLFERELPPTVLDAFLDDLDSGGFTLDCGANDLPRVRALLHRYADLRLGLVDAAVIACAERSGGRVVSLDLRHFGVVGREGTITLLP